MGKTITGEAIMSFYVLSKSRMCMCAEPNVFLEAGKRTLSGIFRVFILVHYTPHTRNTLPMRYNASVFMWNSWAGGHAHARIETILLFRYSNLLLVRFFLFVFSFNLVRTFEFILVISHLVLVLWLRLYQFGFFGFPWKKPYVLIKSSLPLLLLLASIEHAGRR